MTKAITKVIAGLGIVAGLGVAALPLSSYAASEESSNVTVNVTINDTIGTVSPDCANSSGEGAAGTSINSSCGISGSSNAGISILIKDADSTLNLVSGSNTIAPIGGVLTDANFAFTNIANINAGNGGWGYAVASSDAGITVTSGYTDYNPITATDVKVAGTTAASTVSNTSINFRAVTPASQAPGTYTDTVVVTVTTP